ncbi:MAG TPA: hypothetical protein ENK57_03300 [Polyangiaceae bacterium]|nr:hypothetical protein [Polyangiaceae bacterium]
MMRLILAAVLLFDLIGGLLDPAEPIDQTRYEAWGANVAIWWDATRAGEIDMPAIVWLTEDGLAHRGLPGGGRETVPVTLPANVIGVQVGDEPAEPIQLPDLEVRAWTNFSYWAPMRFGAVDMEPTLDEILADYRAPRLTVSEYLLDPLRIDILRFFADHARRVGAEFGQYLGAYPGYETDFTCSYRIDDYRWEAFTGKAFGASLHVWFAYGLDPAKHPEATQGGPPCIEDPTHWRLTRQVNRELRIVAAAVGSTMPADTLETRDLLIGRWPDGARLVVNRHRTRTVKVETSRPGMFADGTPTPAGVVVLEPGFALVLPARRVIR